MQTVLILALCVLLGGLILALGVFLGVWIMHRKYMGLSPVPNIPFINPVVHETTYSDESDEDVPSQRRNF